MVINDAKLFGRIVTAMVTPFDENGEIDYASVERIVEYLVKNKTQTILVAGTTGESPTLSSEEKIALLKKVIQFADGRVRVIFGSGSNNTESSITLSKEAESAGAEGLLIVAPYYNKPSQAGIIAHVQAISESTDLPVIVYNIPGRCGINIEPNTMIRIASECPRVLAIKDSAGNVDQTAELAAKVESDKFRIYSGDDYLTLPMLSVGACGVVSVASHIIGSQIGDMIDAYFEGDSEKARSIHYNYLPVFKGLFLAPNPTCLKYVLSRMGLMGAKLRLPLVPLSDAEKLKVDKMIEEAGLLSQTSIEK